MTRSNLRRAIRANISYRLSEYTESGLRQALITITDTMIDWMNVDGCVEDTDECFEEIREALRELNLDPETLGDEICKAAKSES